jgi:hypothetical protein
MYRIAAGVPSEFGWSGSQCVMPHSPIWRLVILTRFFHDEMPGWRMFGSSAACGFSRSCCTAVSAEFVVSSTSSSLLPSSRCHGSPATFLVTVPSATLIHGWFQYSACSSRILRSGVRETPTGTRSGV